MAPLNTQVVPKNTLVASQPWARLAEVWRPRFVVHYQELIAALPPIIIASPWSGGVGDRHYRAADRPPPPPVRLVSEIVTVGAGVTAY